MLTHKSIDFHWKALENDINCFDVTISLNGFYRSELSIFLKSWQKPGQYICCQNHKLIADIEDDIMDPDTFPFILSFTHCGNKVILRVLRIILVILPEHPSDTKDHLKMEMEMEIPSVKASANSDIIFFFTSAQDGNKLLDDERLSLADDLKKAHDQNQNKSK
ncbi:hypothetical protein Tco_0622225 [Tanacetum coccineum]